MTRPSLRRTLLSVSGTLILSGTPAIARAQSNDGFHGWQLEAHLGGMTSGTAKSASSTLPSPGPPFPGASRYVPSWYFGDGALLANQVGQAQSQVIPQPPIVPLDRILTSPSAARQNGAAFGFRVGRSMTRRFQLEFSMDTGRGKMAISSDALSAIEASRLSFKTYFDAQLGRNPNAQNISTTSVATIENNDTGSLLMGALAVNVAVATVAGFTPYVTAGMGIILPWPLGGSQPTVTLQGAYRFTVNLPGTFQNGAMIVESDAIRIRYEQLPAPVGIFGGGVQRNLTAHTGFRGDVRIYGKANQMKIRLDTNPSTVPQGNVLGRIARGPGPAIQISTLPGFPSSLSPVASVNHFDSFEGKGSAASFSLGYFLRF